MESPLVSFLKRFVDTLQLKCFIVGALRTVSCGVAADSIGRTSNVEFPANVLWKTANFGGGVG